MKPDAKIVENPDSTIDLELNIIGCSPKKGRSLRSVSYFDKVIKVGDAHVYLKVWKKVPRAVREKIVLQYTKERLIKNSPKIL